MPDPRSLKTFSNWLAARNVPQDSIEALLELTQHSADLFESPERIMEPDIWFYYPDNVRFVLLGSCPNGDAIALDTVEEPGAVFFIDHERVADDIPDSERVARVATSLTDYAQCCIDDPEFPYDYSEARDRA